jgi:hypothetical protein
MQSAGPGTEASGVPWGEMQWMTSSLAPCATSSGTGWPATSGALGTGLVPSGPGMFHRIHAHQRT